VQRELVARCDGFDEPCPIQLLHRRSRGVGIKDVTERRGRELWAFLIRNMRHVRYFAVQLGLAASATASP
jgi:hypothetical protein